VLHGFSGQLEVLLGQLPRGLDRLPAPGREEDSVEVARRIRGDPLGELDRARVRIRPEREEGELPRLPGRRLGELDATMPDLHDEEAGETVDVLLASVVPDPVTLAADDDRRAGSLCLPG
jgi:hypothetical protein